jgi:hypothetical protein
MGGSNFDSEKFLRTTQEPIPGLEPVPVVGDPRLAEKKPRKKHAKKGRSLRDMSFEVIPPQAIMRKEMGAGVHKPQLAGEVIDDALGLRPLSDDIATTEAHAIIEEWGEGISTGFREWDIIQDMVERAYRKGYNDGQARARG